MNTKLRQIYGFISLKTLRNTGKVPAGYTFVTDGTDKARGLIGYGFGGEALVCLLDGDNGEWFEQIQRSLYPDADVRRVGFFVVRPDTD